MSKKHILRSLLLVALALIICLSLCSCAYLEALSPDAKPSKGGAKDDKPRDNVVVEGDIEVHFLELGNVNTGDCTYIKAGDKDILIDAGSKASSIKTINDYISEFNSGKLGKSIFEFQIDFIKSPIIFFIVSLLYKIKNTLPKLCVKSIFLLNLHTGSAFLQKNAN